MKKEMEHLKAKKSKMPEHEKSAKMSVLHDIKKQAEGMMKGKLDGMKKVSVASDSSSGLAEGLDKAKQLISKPEKIAGNPLNGEEPAELMEEVVPTHDGHNDLPGSGDISPEEASHEAEDMSPEEIDAEIHRLLEIKKLKSGR